VLEALAAIRGAATAGKVSARLRGRLSPRDVAASMRRLIEMGLVNDRDRLGGAGKRERDAAAFCAEPDRRRAVLSSDADGLAHAQRVTRRSSPRRSRSTRLRYYR
jgi:hypothetical protein